MVMMPMIPCVCDVDDVGARWDGAKTVKIGMNKNNGRMKNMHSHTSKCGECTRNWSFEKIPAQAPGDRAPRCKELPLMSYDHKKVLICALPCPTNAISLPQP